MGAAGTFRWRRRCPSRRRKQSTGAAVRKLPALQLSLCAAAAFLGACAPDHRGEALQQHYVSSNYSVRATPYEYGTPSPYGYTVPWGQPDAETVGYLPADQFSPRPGLVCERGRHVCVTATGIDDAETERYLGSREKWKRDKRFAPPQAYILP